MARLKTNQRIIVGCSSRDERAGRLECGNAVCARIPLACLLTFGRSFSMRANREASYRLRRNNADEFRAQARPQPSEDTPASPTSALEAEVRGRLCKIRPKGGRTSGRVFGRLRSGVKPEIPFKSRRPKAGTAHFVGTRRGSPKRNQASQRFPSAKGVRLFELTGAFVTKTATDKIFSGIRSRKIPAIRGAVSSGERRYNDREEMR
jgi:hypothetical protein